MRLISGDALDTYIRNAAKKKQKTYLFDETYKNHKMNNFGNVSIRRNGGEKIMDNPPAPMLNYTDNPMEEDNDWYDTYEDYEENI